MPQQLACRRLERVQTPSSGQVEPILVPDNRHRVTHGVQAGGTLPRPEWPTGGVVERTNIYRVAVLPVVRYQRVAQDVGDADQPEAEVRAGVYG